MPRTAPLPLAWILAAGCAAGEVDDDAAAVAASLPPRPGVTRQGQAEAARARVDALLAAPGPAPLLAALAQGHGVTRELLGRHTLRYSASFRQVPSAPAPPVVGQRNALVQEIRDDLELRWGSGPGEPVRMSLSQRTDKERGREVTILGEQVYTRALHRGWHARPLDSDAHLRWLDDAQRSVHDVVALAAPALAVAAAEEGEAVRVTLSLAPAADAAQVAGGPGREWRQHAVLTEIAGEIELHRTTGVWRRAELRVAYELTDEAGRTLAGETLLTGALEPAPELAVDAPPRAEPLSERTRYEVERRRLLDGLAGT